MANKVNLPYKFTPRHYQVRTYNAVMDEKFRRGVLVKPRRNGKDLLCWNALLGKAMQRVGLYFYMAPYYIQARQIIWQGSDKEGRRFLDYIPPDLVESMTKLDMRIELINGSQIKLCGSDNIDSIVGTNPIGIVFTEFSLHKPEAWNYLRPILAENDGWALFNGTPRGLNHFYQLFKKAEKLDRWYVEHLTRDDTGIPTIEAINNDRADGMPESLIEQEYYCSWVASSEETLIPLDIVQPAVDNPLRAAHIVANARIIGVDPAYAAKGDQAVIARRQGRLLHPLEKHRGLNNMGLASRVVHWIKTWKPDAVFIDAGRGEGVISRLVQLGYGEFVLPVHFSGKPYSDLYLNKRAEIWGRMRDWFLSDLPPSIPNDEDLLADLSAPMIISNDKGFMQLESKLAMKRRGIKSTDCGDAVALTFAEELDEHPGLNKADHEDMDLHTMEMLRRVVGSQNSTADGEYDVLRYLSNERYAVGRSVH